MFCKAANRFACIIQLFSFVRPTVCNIVIITDNLDINKPLLIKLANRIKELRKQQKITQDELAYRANIGRSTLGNIETAQNDVTFSKINQLAQAFELSLSEFLNF